MKYTISDFNNEMNRISLAALSDVPVNLSHLREIYMSLPVIDENFRYNENETDVDFWKKCQRFKDLIIQ